MGLKCGIKGLFYWLRVFKGLWREMEELDFWFFSILIESECNERISLERGLSIALCVLLCKLLFLRNVEGFWEREIIFRKCELCAFAQKQKKNFSKFDGFQRTICCLFIHTEICQHVLALSRCIFWAIFYLQEWHFLLRLWGKPKNSLIAKTPKIPPNFLPSQKSTLVLEQWSHSLWVYGNPRLSFFSWL